MAVTGPTNVATWGETEREPEQSSLEGLGDFTPTQVTLRTSQWMERRRSVEGTESSWAGQGQNGGQEGPLAGPEVNLLKRGSEGPAEEEDQRK